MFLEFTKLSKKTPKCALVFLLIGKLNKITIKSFGCDGMVAVSGVIKYAA